MADIENSIANSLAIDRTLLAYSRTLMAWVRTALSLISFGFTIYKFLQATVNAEKVGLFQINSPKRFGLILIGLGTLSVIMGTIEYFDGIKRLNTQSAEKANPLNYSLWLGILVGLLGFFLFITIVAHHEVL
jgi:putative membrane protein